MTVKRAYMALMVVLALPVIVPVELFCRIVAPEHRWGRYPAFHEVFETRYSRE